MIRVWRVPHYIQIFIFLLIIDFCFNQLLVAKNLIEQTFSLLFSLALLCLIVFNRLIWSLLLYRLFVDFFYCRFCWILVVKFKGYFIPVFFSAVCFCTFSSHLLSLILLKRLTIIAITIFNNALSMVSNNINKLLLDPLLQNRLRNISCMFNLWILRIYYKSIWS